MRCVINACAIMVFLGVISSFATTYYVKNDGNDGLDGLSDATAWKTVGKVNGYGFKTGDDIYFKCGGTWTGSQLAIDWSGTSENRAVIGAYYSSGTVGVSGSKPVIDGNNTMPSTDYQGLIHVTGDYVKIENMNAINSASEGIEFLGSYDWAYNVTVSNAYRRGVDCKDADYSIVERCDLSDCDNFGNGSVVRAHSATGVKVLYNQIHESSGWSEAVNALHSDDMEIIGNLIYDTRAAGIYLDHAQGTIVKYNLIYYSVDTEYWRYDTAPSDGIWVADEKPQGLTHLSSDLTVAYNIVIGARHGFIMTHNSTTDCGLINTKIVNNTFIEPRTGSAIVINQSGRHSNSIIKNNILYQTSGTIADVCDDSELIFDYNLWSRPESDVDADARGGNDIYDEGQIFVTAGGWHDFDPGDVKGNEASLLSGSSVIDAGTDLGDPFNTGISPASLWPYNVVLDDQDNHGTWEIGAIIYSSEAIMNVPGGHAMSGMPGSTDPEIYNVQGVRMPVTGSLPTGIYIITAVEQGKPIYKKVWMNKTKFRVITDAN